MSSQFFNMSEMLIYEARRLSDTNIHLNVEVARRIEKLSSMIPPDALIHSSQEGGVFDTLFRLFDITHPNTQDGDRAHARDMREATIFLSACSTF